MLTLELLCNWKYTVHNCCINQKPFSEFLRDTYPWTVALQISMSLFSDCVMEEDIAGAPGGGEAPGGFGVES